MDICFGKIDVKDYTIDRYKKVYEKKEGMRLVESHEGLFGFLDNETGELKIPCIYSYAEGFSEGKALVETTYEEDGIVYSRTYEYINKEGRVVIGRLNVTGASSFHDNRALVHYGTGYWYIDELGNDISRKLLTSGTDYHEGLAVVLPHSTDFFNKRVAVDVCGDVCVTLPRSYYFLENAMFYGGFAPIEKVEVKERAKPRRSFRAANRYETIKTKAFVTSSGEIVEDALEVERISKIYEAEKAKALNHPDVPVGNKKKLFWYCSDIICFGKAFHIQAETLEECLVQKRAALEMIEQRLLAIGSEVKVFSEATRQRLKRETSVAEA